MTDKLATFIANFQETRQFKAVLEPSSPQIGQPFKIKIYAQRPVGILSHYGVILSSTTESEPLKEEIIPLNGSPEYPVRQWVYHKLANNIVNVETRSLAYLAGGDIPENLTDDDIYAGSIDAKYYPFYVQIFEHQGIANPGECVLWAFDENGCFYDIRFTVSKAQTNDGQYSIVLEGHDRTITINKYAIRMFPADADIETFVSRGLLEELPNQLIEKTETINLNFADSVKTQFEISEFIEVNYEGSLFLDEDYNQVSASVWPENGVLKVSKKVTGAVTVRYKTLARMFNYTPPNGNWVQFFGGAKMVAHSKPKKTFQIFDIPLPSAEFFDKTVVARVYRELVIADKRYEMPTTFSESEISYASYPGADTSNLEVDSPKVEVNQVEIQWNGFNVNADEFQSPSWVFPTQAGTNFADIQWKIEEKIPPELEGSDLQQVQDKISEIKTKYGIV